MIVKVIALFLAGMAILALFGRLRFPAAARRAKTCPHCGRPLIGRGPCDCQKKG